MAEKEVSGSSAFDHVAALNNAGFAVKGVQRFGKHEFDLGSRPAEVKQQAVLMTLLDKPVEQAAVHDAVRAERRVLERERLTAALHSVLDSVSPFRSTAAPVENKYKRYKNLRTQVPTAITEQQDVEVRVAMRELFGDTSSPEPVKVPLLNKILNYKIEFTPPAFLFRQSHDQRMNIINQLKEVYK